MLRNVRLCLTAGDLVESLDLSFELLHPDTNKPQPLAMAVKCVSCRQRSCRRSHIQMETNRPAEIGQSPSGRLEACRPEYGDNKWDNRPSSLDPHCQVCEKTRRAGVAQWQSSGFVNHRLEVQFLSPAPRLQALTILGSSRESVGVSLQKNANFS